jgi:uncharacterized membrane protein YphA (DoxX/SURF4 family)
MVDEFFNSVGQRLRDLVGGAYHSLIEPLYLLEWYAWLALILGACLLIGYFAPFKWVRAALGLILLLAGAFVAGGTAMYRHMRRSE